MELSLSTPLIEIETGSYPMYLSQVISHRADVVFEAEPTVTDLRAFGYAVVHPVEKPIGDVVTEGCPVLVDGEYHQSWSIQTFTPEEKAAQLETRKQELAKEVLAIRETDLAGGFLYTLNENTIFGVQLRPEDRVNLIGLRMEAMYLVDRHSTQLSPFRSTENISYPLTPTELLDLCNTALAAGKKIYANSWAIKDQIEAATTMAELPVLPNTLISE